MPALLESLLPTSGDWYGVWRSPHVSKFTTTQAIITGWLMPSSLDCILVEVNVSILKRLVLVGRVQFSSSHSLDNLTTTSCHSINTAVTWGLVKKCKQAVIAHCSMNRTLFASALLMPMLPSSLCCKVKVNVSILKTPALADTNNISHKHWLMWRTSAGSLGKQMQRSWLALVPNVFPMWLCMPLIVVQRTEPSLRLHGSCLVWCHPPFVAKWRSMSPSSKDWLIIGWLKFTSSHGLDNSSTTHTINNTAVTSGLVNDCKQATITGAEWCPYKKVILHYGSPWPGYYRISITLNIIMD